MHETTLKYLDACQYARQVLGDAVAAPYFERLHKLARTNSIEELQSIVRGWRPPRAKESGQLESENSLSTPESKEWGGPCKHWGGSRECPTCLRENAAAGVRLAGALAIADRMFQEHRAFVLTRIYGECLPFTGGRAYSQIDDLEQNVWQAVTARIAKYENRDQPLAWLKTVVHSIVVNHFRDEFRKKRDVRKTVQLDPVKHDGAKVSTGRTSVPVKPENDTRTIVFNEADIPFFKK